MKLSLNRSTIRSYRKEDADSLIRHIGTLSVARHMSLIPHPYEQKHAEEWLAIATEAKPETHFAITIDDQVVGGIGVTPSKLEVSAHCAELGYWLGEALWGRGVMTEAVTTFTEWAFENLNLRRLHAAVYAHNPASARVLVKSGYTFEGRQRARYFKYGQYIDGLMFARVREPLSAR